MTASHPPLGFDTPVHASRYRRRATAQMTVQFVGRGQLVALCVAMLALGVMLFPKALIDRQLHTLAAPDATTIAYLQLLLRAQPDELTTRMQLVRQRLRAGQLQQAESELAPLVERPGPPPGQVGLMWLTLRRAQFLAVPATAPQRALVRARYARALSQFGSQLTPTQQVGELHRAIDAGMYQVAAQLAGELLTGNALKPASQTVARGRDGAGYGGVQPSGVRSGPPDAQVHRQLEPGLRHMIGLIWSSRFDPDTSTRAPLATARSSLRGQAFDALLQSHLAAGHPAAALDAAEATLPTMNDEQVDWARLIQIAVWADQPAAAADFASRWLGSARDNRTRWTAFHALIDAYLAAGHPAQALSAATLQLQRMPQDTALWRVMTQLAMQAGNGQQAARYARRLVSLESAGDH